MFKYKTSYADFCVKLHDYWIFQKGKKLKKDKVFDKHYDNPVIIELIVSRMYPEYTYKHRKDIDPHYVSSTIDQEKLEQERLLEVIKQKTTILLRDNGTNQPFFNNKKIRNTLESCMVWMFNNYKEIEKEVNHLPNK